MKTWQNGLLKLLKKIDDHQMKDDRMKSAQVWSIGIADLSQEMNIIKLFFTFEMTDFRKNPNDSK
jgi:hypothetical protein